MCGGTVNRGTTGAPRLDDCSCTCHRTRRFATSPQLPADARRDALERAGYRCEARAPGCWTDVLGAGLEFHCHHKLRRAQGGGDELDNLLVVCPACHAYIHANPEASYEAGWLIRSSVAPRR